jgi:hypothetical protein
MSTAQVHVCFGLQAVCTTRTTPEGVQPHRPGAHGSKGCRICILACAQYPQLPLGHPVGYLWTVQPTAGVSTLQSRTQWREV